MKLKSLLKKEKRFLLFFLIFIPCVALFISGVFLSVTKRPIAEPDNVIPKFSVEELPTTGEGEIVEEELGNSTLLTYTNGKYGYSFDYPSDIKVMDLTLKGCKGLSCVKIPQARKDFASLEDLNISTFYSSSILDFAYDEGLDRSLYKEPRQTTIGDKTYYYIISNEGFVEMITSDFRYQGEILWVKTDQRVDGANGAYYIAFDPGISINAIPEEDIEEIDKVLKSFRF
ncbi:hypothetical protein JW766_04610 [Candidatus Dojkabacteria bacterium]|nr:hypothetical protein [Candidatus Dojkabacteria bacterium]